MFIFSDEAINQMKEKSDEENQNQMKNQMIYQNFVIMIIFQL